MLGFILILITLPSLLVSVDFIQYLFRRKRLYPFWVNIPLEIVSVLIFPLIYLNFGDARLNDCCGESATFSPEHRLTIYVFIGISIISYFYSTYKSEIHSPILEVLTNTIILFGFLLNIFVAIQIKDSMLWTIGNIPIGILFLFQLLKNHQKFIEEYEENAKSSENFFEKLAWKTLQQSIFVKLPLFFILCIPFIKLITFYLLLFGQNPDSLIRAFTDTYKHGFSQLDYLCENVECGGHFLCSVAANGHKHIVKPIRYGERNGKKIICNRQLLIANAFEELVAEKIPKTHKIIRKNYNKVGDIVHKHYHFFENKFVSDLIYFVMKPFELLFIFTLYTFDKKPENRIAKQYCKQI